MRVQWHIGQALLPAHFFAQEESLRAEQALRFSLISPRGWGVGDLRWDEAQLANATLAVREMVLVFESGTVISVPGNASVASLDLSTVGSTRVSVYAHLEPGFDVVTSLAGAADEDGIERIRQKIELTTTDPGEPSIKIAELLCPADGQPEICIDYVPPLIGVTKRLFEGPWARIEMVLNALEYQFKDELTANHLAGDTQILAKQALRSVLAVRTMLVDIEGPPPMPVHPYELYRALRGLYIDTCLLRNAEYSEATNPYDHRAIGASFQRLLTPLEEMIRRGVAGIPYVEFSRGDGRLHCALKKDANQASRTYLLIQKPSVMSKVDASRIKLASPSRLRAVHERALTGIEIHPVPRPPFAQCLSLTVDMYELRPGYEWDSAVEAGQIVLFDAPQIQECRLYLYSLQAQGPAGK